MKRPELAFDRSSARSYDADGRMHVAKTHISKANVCPYLGSEIPGWQGLGLQPDKVYNLYRDPAELEKGAASFNNLPLLRRHIQVSADEPMKDDVVGSIGSDVAFSAPYLDASLCIWDAEAIAAVESGQLEELSSAYRYTPVMEPGTTPEGEAYDGRMTNIRGNHLALVEVGRAGPDVVVADASPFHIPASAGVDFPQPTKETPAMKQTKLGRALMVALSAASPKIAQDSALPALVGRAVKGQFDTKAVSAKLCAMDEEMGVEKIDEIIDAVLGVEENPEPVVPETMAGDNDVHGQVMEFLQGRLSPEDMQAVGDMLSSMEKPMPAADEESEEPEPAGMMKEEDVKGAMDALRNELRAEFRALEKAKSDVRPVVGDVIGEDSAAGVYRFALAQMGIAFDGMPDAGLAILFATARDGKKPAPVHIASDSATINAEIPGLARFR